MIISGLDTYQPRGSNILMINSINMKIRIFEFMKRLYPKFKKLQMIPTTVTRPAPKPTEYFKTSTGADDSDSVGEIVLRPMGGVCVEFGDFVSGFTNNK